MQSELNFTRQCLPKAGCTGWMASCCKSRSVGCLVSDAPHSDRIPKLAALRFQESLFEFQRCKERYLGRRLSVGGPNPSPGLLQQNRHRAEVFGTAAISSGYRGISTVPARCAGGVLLTRLGRSYQCAHAVAGMQNGSASKPQSRCRRTPANPTSIPTIVSKMGLRAGCIFCGAQENCRMRPQEAAGADLKIGSRSLRST
jgi:hypothetical protein